jgi:peptide-methionine (S)-S-oxide reductase
VIKTAVGYSNGQSEAPTYEAVCSGKTGHAEVVQVAYDTSVVSMHGLMDVFWASLKDPTQTNGQGNDIGSQYRIGIYYHSDEQHAAAAKFLVSNVLSLRTRGTFRTVVRS